ncbi:hypothetical protein RJ639_000804 [Escallonia herrerae]|uniref:Integrase catalytic domain-containing protein n=1 Tax=Escallonia herrerae TaxID=1293975 RepID=A0AA88XAQ0_9ASTE|nr:hypothetical protein RJ639_000804 [Escallonia herrerae]
MARSAERCSPFFKAIRKAKNFVWTDDCQKSFEELKTHLSSPPLLSKPLPGKDLLIYLSVTEVAVSTVLIREEDGVQKPIYYASKVLQDVETRYPKIYKIALALIISARRLQPYFQSHTIVVLTDQPLRKVLLSPEASGRLKDAIEFTRRCDKCQKFAPVSHTPVSPLTSIVSPIPFAVWGMDLLGPFPMASGQRQVPRALVVDNSKQFDNNNFRTFCSNFSIDLRFTSVAHPQSNGQIENMNRSILQGLKKKLDEAKGAWVDELSKVLWAYRTTPHSVTGETPFSLCYGTEAMLPVEIGVPTIRALHFNKLNNDVGLRANLDLVEEARTQAHVRSVAIKRVARYYNQRVRSK